MKVNVRIPVVVRDNGEINGWVTMDSNGKHSEDEAIIYDGFPEDANLRKVYITAEIDVDAIFKDTNVSGQTIVLTEDECSILQSLRENPDVAEIMLEQFAEMD